MSLHAKNGLVKKDKKKWRCDKILVHLKEFGPLCKAMLIDPSEYILDQC